MTYEGRAELLEYQDVEKEIDAIYAERRRLHREYLEELEARRDELIQIITDRRYKLPERRHQTPTQQKVQRCPRCTGRFDNDDED